MPAETKTTCPYCGVGCGVITTVADSGAVTVKGDPDHPANFGRLCSKGSALAETIDLDGRILHPEIDGKQTSWAEALDLVAAKFSEAIAEHGPDSVAFYVSGQLLTEDYYVANKLMKGFIGSANIDTNSRLCMSSSVAGHRRAFGSDTVPGTYEDLELPGHLPAACSRQSRTTGNEDRRHRPAPDDDLRYRRSASGNPPGWRCGTVHGPARASCRQPGDR
jgi:assimilatory nitrate reductase catalytic subunit